MRPPARALIVALSFVASSILIHVAVIGETRWLEWLALVSLVFVPASLPLIALQLRAWLIFAAVCVGLWWLVQYGGGRPLLYLPSILIPAALAWFFGRTLAAGRRPLITSVALAARPATPEYLLTYSRRLTQMWTGIFMAMTLWDCALAAFASREAWSFMANGINYLVIGATVAFEYLFRRLKFRDYDHPGFVEYIRIVISADPRRMREP